MLDGPPLGLKTPRRKRARIAKDQLDDSFLRRSRTPSKKFARYKDVESAKKAKKAAPIVEESTEEDPAEEEEPMPLSMIPPSSKNVAPHLPRDILAGIGEGFLQI